MKYHLVAIGGAVMHNIALALKAQGHEVSGSDDLIHEPSLGRLEAAGLLPAELGWFPERISTDLDAVILGMHAHLDNPELVAAKRLNLPVYSFPEFVFRYCRNKQRIVVAGSHGKTTVTCMLMHALRLAGRDFDYVVGANVEGFGSMVRLSETAPVILIEGDEYPTSALDPRPKFLNYEPHILVLTGIAWDHVNAYPTEEAYEAQFQKLLQSLPKAATCIYNKEDRTVRELVAKALHPEANYPIPYGKPAGRVRAGKQWVRFEKSFVPVQVYGEHNLANLAAAHEALRQLALKPDRIAEYLGSFKGAALRMEHVYEDAHTLVIRDFAHAPSKVKATTEAVLSRFKDRNVVVALELSTYSSLNLAFLPQFRNTLKKAKNPLIYISKATLETKRLKPISEEYLRQAFHDKSLELAHEPTDLAKRLRARRSPSGPDVILLMSSGSFDGLELKELVK